MNIREHWWKIAGVLLVSYSIVAGLWIPLGPGVIEVDPYQINEGSDVKLSIRTYNTDFSDQSPPRAWLKLDSVYSIEAMEVFADDTDEATLHFSIPRTLPYEMKEVLLTLIIDHPTSGTAVLPRAVHLNSIKEGVRTQPHQTAWQKDGIRNLMVSKGIVFPYRSILEETIRNVFFHVAFWMAMFVLLTMSCWYSVRYLKTKNLMFDRRACALAEVGLLYGIIGLVTGMVWAKYTWGAMWSGDIKQNMTAVALMIYAVYFVLRSSVNDQHQSARFSSVYNILAFASLLPLLFIIPRMVDSLHPGSGGNPALGSEDLDNTMRLIFYPAIAGWILIGWWLSDIHTKIQNKKNAIHNF